MTNRWKQVYFTELSNISEVDPMLENILKKTYDFLKEEQGATAVEYVIMLVLIVAVIIVTVGVLGDRTADSFNEFNNRFSAAGS